ncbi:MAG: thioredoxin-dependent thiol peroxidase [Thermoplasmata archaeon]|nr:thioredoxin-dependent thiol peroxidase [Thermoplasmata archaeon]
MPEEGDTAPEFCLPDGNGEEVCLKDFRGKWLVLYFYPKDNTSGCTQEARDFSALIEDFRRIGAEVVGISPDSPESHRRFADKHGLKVTLLSDQEHSVLERYGVWQLKRMYGREYYGVVRSTFLLDPKGVIRKVWRRVKVKGHVDEVLETLKSLNTPS